MRVLLARLGGHRRLRVTQRGVARAIALGWRP